MSHPATEFILDLHSYARAYYGIQLKDGACDIPIEIAHTFPMSPTDGVKTTPKEIRAGRRADHIDSWSEVVRSFNPNTIGIVTPRTFWKGLSNHLVYLPPSDDFSDDLDVLSYDENKPQRVYAADLKILRNVGTPKENLHDFGHDPRTAYLRSLIFQGMGIARRLGLYEQVGTDGVVEPAGDESDVHGTSDPEGSDTTGS